MKAPQSFQAFTIKANGRINRILTDVEIFPPFDPKSPPKTAPPHYKAKALWDTGATGSAITSAVAKALGLAPVGVVNVNHAGGVTTSSSTYLVNIGLPNQVMIPGILVAEFASNPEFDVIIGMDILARGDFSLTHVGGRACVSFRVPSCEEIDFVAEANRRLFKNVGRNDACPCGRRDTIGRPVKYKNCHGMKAVPAGPAP